MPDPPLLGDSDALYMACPAAPAAELAAWLPSGPVLEFCCGVGGLTRELARAGHRVLAVDVDLARLIANHANLAALGLRDRVSHLCCDLQQPALRAPVGRAPFAAAVLDPDWSPSGAPPDQWASRLEEMIPPADDLIKLAFTLSPLVVIRLPRAISIHAPNAHSLNYACREIGSARSWRWLALSER